MRILDKDLNLKARLNPESWQYNRRRNVATDISVTVAKNELRRVLPIDGRLYQELAREGLLHLTIANFVQIYKGSDLRASGVIVERDVGDDTIEIKAFTEEELLRRNTTPAQYGDILSGQDITDVLREIVDGWETKRVKTQEQWELTIRNGGRVLDSNNIDTTTEPGVIMLEKTNGDYATDGFIELRFENVEYDNFKRWDRIRWLGDFEEGVVETTIQYRYGEDEGDLTDYSSEIEGTLTDTIGFVPDATDEKILDIRINLSTSDTDKTPFFFAVELIARTEFPLEIGNVPNSLNLAVDEIEADYENCLDLLQDACEQTGTEFTIRNRTIDLNRDLGRDLTNEVMIRNGTNMNITNLSDEDEDLTNVIIAIGEGDGIDRPQIQLKQEQSILEYGEYPEVVEFNADEINELELLAQTYLEDNAFPATTFSIDAQFDPGNEPDYKFDDIVKVVDPETETVINIRIDEETRSYDSNGVSVNLELARTRKRLLEGVLEPRKIRSAKEAQFLFPFETTWDDPGDHLNPFYELIIPFTIGDGVYPSIREENIAKYVAVFDENMNELARTGLRTIDYGVSRINATYFLELDVGVAEQVAHIGWISGQNATNQAGTGTIYDTKPFTTEFRFLPIGKTERRGY